MIYIKTHEEIKKMRIAGDLVARLLEYIKPYVKENTSTLELDNICVDWIKKKNAIAAPLNYKGFPKSICSSINQVVCHGIPKKEDILKNGDIINIDITLIYGGYFADSSKTFIVGKPDPNILLLVKRTNEALHRAINALSQSKYLNVIGEVIENYVKPFSYGVVQELGGHGVGKFFHEDPFIAHYKDNANKILLKPGMTFTIEPMINEGSAEVFVDENDEWTVRTEDNSFSAQFEHTVLIKNKGVEILTLPL